MNRATTAEPIEMPFGLWTAGGHKKLHRVLKSDDIVMSRRNQSKNQPILMMFGA